MGEIVPPLENNFEPGITLTWKNVVFSNEGEVLIFIPYSKSTGFKGKIIDLYPVTNCKFCPVASLKRLKKTCFGQRGLEIGQSGIYLQEREISNQTENQFMA